MEKRINSLLGIVSTLAAIAGVIALFRLVSMFINVAG